jgi:hypothetical protein
LQEPEAQRKKRNAKLIMIFERVNAIQHYKQKIAFVIFVLIYELNRNDVSRKNLSFKGNMKKPIRRNFQQMCSVTPLKVLLFFHA